MPPFRACSSQQVTDRRIQRKSCISNTVFYNFHKATNESYEGIHAAPDMTSMPPRGPGNRGQHLGEHEPSTLAVDESVSPYHLPYIPKESWNGKPGPVRHRRT